MPYPPKPPRKHPDLWPGEARSQHLVPYRYQPGVSGNPSGMSKSARELYLEARSLAHQLGPGAIRRLGELAGISDPDLPWVPLAQLEIDPRVVYMASVALAERAYGKVREAEAVGTERKFSDLEPAEREREVERLIALGKEVIARRRAEEPEADSQGGGDDPPPR